MIVLLFSPLILSRKKSSFIDFLSKEESARIYGKSQECEYLFFFVKAARMPSLVAVFCRSNRSVPALLRENFPFLPLPACLANYFFLFLLSSGWENEVGDLMTETPRRAVRKNVEAMRYKNSEGVILQFSFEEEEALAANVICSSGNCFGFM